MGIFSARNGFVYYVFANEDTYYLDSMIRLNLTDYLYYLLRKEYSQIVFINGNQASYHLQVFDDPSYDYCSSQMQSVWAHFLLGKPEKKQEGNRLELTCNEAQILKILRNAKKTAFVFPLFAFQSLLGAHVDAFNQLKENARYAKNIALLLTPTAADKSLPLFEDPEGIFRKQVLGSALFPEITRALSADNFFYQLKVTAADRCVFFNKFSREAIRRVIRWVLWSNEEYFSDYRDEIIRSVTEYVYMNYHSNEFEYRVSNLSENKFHRFSELARDLQNYWPMIRREAEVWASGNERTTEYREQCVIQEDDINRHLESIHFPLHNKTGKGSPEARWRELLRLYRVPRRRIRSQELLQELVHSIDSMNRAASRNDDQTFGRAIQSLRYALDHHFVFSEREQTVWQAYEKLILLSEELFKLECENRKNQDTILEWTHAISLLREEIMQERRSKGKWADDDFAVKQKMRRASEMEKQKRHLTGRIDVNHTFLSRYHQYILSLETFIEQPEIEKLTSINEIMDEANQTIEQDLRSRKKSEESFSTISALDIGLPGEPVAQEYDTLFAEDLSGDSLSAQLLRKKPTITLPDSIDDMLF